MNPHLQSAADFIKTERMQVILILALILASAFLTVYFVVLPQRDIHEQNRELRAKLEGNRFANQSFKNMQDIAEQERKNLQTLSNEWFRTTERLATLQKQATTRIDYKVELYEIRERLRTKSEELKIALLAEDLGVDDTLTSDEDALTRMLQLKAVELLADLALDWQIQKLVEIYPLPPVTHTDKNGQKTFTEYPVRVECDVDFTYLYSFFQSVFEENQVFAFRNVRIESRLDTKLRVKAILSALLFD